MRPSEVRERVLADHRTLRRDLDRLEALARAGVGRVCVSSDTLRVESERLLARLQLHMHWEERHLLPALREADAWGAERAERLVADHREQRELLDFVLLRLRDATRPARVVVSDIQALIELLREDMREEEAELLDERVLRDDVVGIAVESG